MDGARNLRRLLVEFSVIVVGVLVALFAESWWSDREERAFEAEVRSDVIAEFRENLEILIADSAQNAVVEPIWRRFAGVDPAALAAMSSEEANAIFDLPPWQVFDPASGMVQALLQSGGLSAIEDRELRRLLARWTALLARYNRYAARAEEMVSAQLTPIRGRILADGVATREEREESRIVVGLMTFWLDAMWETEPLLRAEARTILARLED